MCFHVVTVGSVWVDFLCWPNLQLSLHFISHLSSSSLHNSSSRPSVPTPHFHPTSHSRCIFITHSSSSSHIFLLSLLTPTIPQLFPCSSLFHLVNLTLLFFASPFISSLPLFLFFLSLLTCRICLRGFSACVLHNHWLAVCLLVSNAVFTLLLFSFFPSLCSLECVCVAVCSRAACAFTGLVMHLHLGMSLSTCFCICMYVSICECVCVSEWGWFYQLLQMAPASHPSFQWNEEPSEEWRQRRKEWTDRRGERERVRGRWHTGRVRERERRGMVGNSERLEREEGDQKMQRLRGVMGRETTRRACLHKPLWGVWSVHLRVCVWAYHMSASSAPTWMQTNFLILHQ